MARRRMNDEGTIYQRANGLWVCEITLGYDKDKKRIKKTISSMDRDKLQKKINDLKYLNDRRLLIDPSKYTVGEWVEFWLETYKKPSIKPSTYDMYKGNLERYIKPKIGHYKLDKLNPLVVQTFINDISSNSLNTKHGLSQSSVKKVYITLSQACKQAVTANILYKNPCDGVQLPKKPPRESVAFTVEEQEAFLQHCPGNTTFENLFIFAFNTGMRLGEMLALTWKDIDTKDKVVSVNKSLSVVNDYDEKTEQKNKTIIDTTKTESGKRTIPLTSAAFDCVERQRLSNKKKSPFVFYSHSGTPLMKRNIYRAFNDILKKADIKTHLTLHSMRHSFATRLLEKGADIKTVSELLVNAIYMGLLDARNELMTSKTVTNNRKHMAKWDFINTSVTNSLLTHERYSIVPLDRGLFEVIMIYDNLDKVLYTVMKRQNFNKLTGRNSISKAHYIDAMLDVNSSYQKSPKQLSLLEDSNLFSENAENQIQILTQNIKILLNTNEILRYITIVVDFTGYTLTTVEAIFCSKWLEVIESDNWNDYITPTYDEAENINSTKHTPENEIKSKIKIKPAVKKKFGLA